MSENKRILGVAGGAVGFGGLAAMLGTCCAAPWAVTLLGVSGAVALARLARYQPYLLVVATVLLILAFYLAYRPAPACVDGTCVVENRRRLRVAVWIAAILVAILATASYVAAYSPF